jgi:hypothetical protein
MINQLVYKTFSDNHRQVLLREAEANRMIRRVQTESSNTNRRRGSLLSLLKLRRVSQPKTHHPSKEGELELGFY